MAIDLVMVSWWCKLMVRLSKNSIENDKEVSKKFILEMFFSLVSI